MVREILILVIFVATMAGSLRKALGAAIIPPPLIFNASVPAENSSVRNSWLPIINRKTITPQYHVDFESGYSNQQNINGIQNILPGGLTISSTAAVVSSDSGDLGGSSAIGSLSLGVTGTEVSFAFEPPVDYVGLLDFGHPQLSFYVGSVNDMTSVSFGEHLDESAASIAPGEFFGLHTFEGYKISAVTIFGNTSFNWGLDDLEYGVVPEPSPGIFFFALLISLKRRMSFQTK